MRVLRSRESGRSSFRDHEWDGVERDSAAQIRVCEWKPRRIIEQHFGGSNKFVVTRRRRMAGWRKFSKYPWRRKQLIVRHLGYYKGKQWRLCDSSGGILE